MNIVCQLVKFGSKEQVESIELRRKVLRVPLGLDFSKEELALEGHQFHFVAAAFGKIVGVLILVAHPNGILKMRQVAVDSEIQNQGIGQQLVEFSEKWAINNTYNLMVLNARKAAVPFYLKLNYQVTSTEFMEVGIAHVTMQKNLF